MQDVYLRSDFDQSLKIKGSIRSIYIFSGVALLLLLIACINFINLSASRVVSRLRETGVRKILGAGRKDIVLQFLMESVVCFMVSLILALALYQSGL